MRIIKPTTIKRFAAEHPDAALPLMRWLEFAEGAQWRNLVEVRRQYPSADGVKVGSGREVVVFNIRGNRYRLIAAIHYSTGIIFTLRFLTHAEYDKENWKATL